jgi:peptidoglycan/LPS O-acetylase OafA/YrhL
VTARNTQTHVRDLDALRGIAIFGVVMTHITSSLGLMGMYFPGTTLDLTQFFVTGGLGVPLFFVLSGYLLTLTESRRYAAGTGSVPAYARRRFLRLAPAYYFSLLVYIAIAVQTDSYKPWIHPVVDIAAYLGFLHGLWWQSGSSVDFSYWSLTCEFAFYCSLPLILRYATRIRFRVLLYLALLGLSASCYYLSGRYPGSAIGWYLIFNPATHLHIFIAGSLLASLSERWRHARPARLPRVTGDALLLLALTGIILNAYVRSTSPVPFVISRLGTETLVAIGFAAYVVGSPLLTRILAFPGLARLGLISFSVFLFHNMMMDVAERTGLVRDLHARVASGTPTLVVFGLYLAWVLAITIGIARVSYACIEVPGMNGFGLLRGSLSRRTARPILDPLAADLAVEGSHAPTR